ncbi:MAG: VOC family protein [Fastidiosipilaceae bacterium]|jgi:methylmalonyl-CoA/ethylmalonyl-CoA epimerase|nr:hypothetical protein [Clostridiaceae bacterium]
MKNGLFYELEQIGLVAADAKAMAKNYEEILGIGPWNFLEFKLSPDEEQKTVIASGKIKDVELEIIEPHSDKVIHTKFLEDNGPGLHHLLFRCDDMDKASAYLIEKGLEVLEDIKLGSVRWMYFDGRELFGAIIEVHDMGDLA